MLESDFSKPACLSDHSAFSMQWSATCSQTNRLHSDQMRLITQAWHEGITSSIGCANRSCGPPKPGRLLLSGVRRCRRRSAGGPSGPDGAPEGPWGRRGVPYGSVHQSCTDTGQSSDPSSPVGSRRAKTGFRRKPVGTRYGPTGPDEPRRITRPVSYTHLTLPTKA